MTRPPSWGSKASSLIFGGVGVAGACEAACDDTSSTTPVARLTNSLFIGVLSSSRWFMWVSLVCPTLRIRRGGRTPTVRHRSRAIAPVGLVNRRRQVVTILTTQALHLGVMLLEPRDVRGVRLKVVGEQPQELSRVLGLGTEWLERCGGHLIGHFSVARPFPVVRRTLPSEVDRCPDLLAGIRAKDVEEHPATIAVNLVAVELKKPVRTRGERLPPHDHHGSHFLERALT